MCGERLIKQLNGGLRGGVEVDFSTHAILEDVQMVRRPHETAQGVEVDVAVIRVRWQDGTTEEVTDRTPEPQS